jgi:hypothetical protein
MMVPLGHSSTPSRSLLYASAVELIQLLAPGSAFRVS